MKIYQAMLQNYDPLRGREPQLPLQTLQITKSKHFYRELVQLKAEKHISESKWKQTLNLDQHFDFQTAYNKKIRGINENKLAEFNYKTIHLILSCNYNLKKWGISDSDKCEICNIRQDILHLLYTCVHSRKIWQLIEKVLDVDLNEADVILGNDLDKKHNYIATIISFTIYKEWLICRDMGISRINFNTQQFFINELYLKMKVYNLIEKTDIANQLRR